MKKQLKQILGHYGPEAQKKKSIEELSELINEVDRLQERADKAEAKLRRIKQVAIHTAQGNCIIPSSMILDGEA